MVYRLDELEQMSKELGLEARRVDADRVGVVLADGVLLIFCNLPGGDTLVGFEGSQWHAHGTVQFSRRDRYYVECDELDMLIGLGSGELVVVSQCVDGLLTDRWLAHKDQPLDLRHIKAGEELKVLRLADRASQGAG